MDNPFQYVPGTHICGNHSNMVYYEELRVAMERKWYTLFLDGHKLVVDVAIQEGASTSQERNRGNQNNH